MRRQSERGSIIVYIVIAIFLTGLLIATLSQGSKKSVSAQQIDEFVLKLQEDLKTIQLANSECVQTYSSPVAGLTNPNVPFPVYNDLSSGGTGDVLTAIRCPGAPTAQQIVFSGEMANRLSVLGNTATYTTQYFNDATEGVYVRITRASADPLWTEAITRINAKYSACTVAGVTAAGVCVNGCLYYWVLRRATSVVGPEAGCP